MLTAPGTCLEIDIELHEQKKKHLYTSGSIKSGKIK